MPETRAQLVRDEDTGKLVQRDVELTPIEEAAERAKDTKWAVDTSAHEREEKIQNEMSALLRRMAIAELQRRGEIS